MPIKFFQKGFFKWRQPNYRNRETDNDGYAINYIPKVGTVKIHRWVAFQVLGISKLPKGYVVHHRDANKLNNDRSNLVVLSNKDRTWLHKEVGNAILKAISKGVINIDLIVSYSKDKEKLRKLLLTQLDDQVGLFKGWKSVQQNPANTNPWLSRYRIWSGGRVGKDGSRKWGFWEYWKKLEIIC